MGKYNKETNTKAVKKWRDKNKWTWKTYMKEWRAKDKAKKDAKE